MQGLCGVGARLGVALAVSGGALGCSFESKGVSELLGGTESYVNFPGERWASGHFSGVSISGDPGSGEYLLAFRDGVELTLTPAGSHETCSLGAAAVYQSSWRAFGDDRAPAVAFLEEMDESGRGKLSFAFADCTVWSTGLEHAELPVFAAENYLVRDARADGDALVEVDPWQQTLRDVAVGVQRAYQLFAGGPLITFEASQLVWRDAQLRPTVVATGVSELVSIDLAFVFLAGRTLGVIDGTIGFSVVDLDACELRSVDAGGASRGFSFLSPCDKHTLRVRTGSSPQIYTIAEPADGAGARVAISPYYKDDSVQVITDGRALPAPDSRWLGTLWGGHLSDDASTPVTLEKWGEAAFAAPFNPSPAFRYLRPLRFLSDFDGTSGRLMEAGYSNEVSELADHVAEFDGNLAIVRPDSGGDQLLGAFRETPAVFTTDVSSLTTTSWYTQSRDDKYALAVAHDAGSLDYAVLSAAGWRDGNQVEFQRAAENVHSASLSWSDFGALGYLRDYDSELRQGTLALYFVDSKDVFEQPGVGQWSEARLADHLVILYTVPRGSNAGVWVAAVK